jgi:general L-amino acid transport system permease protein
MADRSRHAQARALIWQLLIGAALALFAWWIVSNTAENLSSRGIASGFDFLFHEAGFEISESVFLAYDAGDTYLRALAVGVLNTLRVAAIAIALATGLGALLGVARLSPNWLARSFAAGYVESIRNVPLLVQLFFWYALLTEYVPPPAEALNPLPGVFVSNRGVAFPLPRLFSPWEYPQLSGFNFTGGATLSPEFSALVIGLGIYTAAFIAEIVRGGILSVDAGQWEAAFAGGLARRQALRFVIVPQALRAMLPPLTSQYLNVTKNSSLAVAIGYPDLVSVANTIINQTGQAIEGIAIIMAVYLTISLSLSAVMNWHNRRVAVQGVSA